MASSGNDAISLKVVIDEEKKRVVFAEANSELVDVLFSFLTMPLGTIQRLLPHANIGSFNNLYGSMSNLDNKYFSTPKCKDMLINTKNAAESKCQYLKINIGGTKPPRSFGPGMPAIRRNEGVFVAQTASFIISDDLRVTPNILGSTLGILEKSGITDFRLLEENTLELGPSEILKLLEYSILSKTPLADMVFGKEDIYSDFGALTLRSQISKECINYDMRMTIKVFVQKLNNKILLVQTSSDFIDFLFSFLILPLGRVVSLLSANCASTLGVINTYQSILDPNVAEYLISQEMKKMLLYPRLTKLCKCGCPILLPKKDTANKKFNDISSDDEEFGLAFPNCSRRGFVKAKTMFMVTDDLVVTPFSSTSCITFLQSLELLPSDVVEQEISIGMEEAINLLIASLSSTSVLTSGLQHLILKMPNEERMLKRPKRKN